MKKLYLITLIISFIFIAVYLDKERCRGEDGVMDMGCVFNGE